MISPNITFFVDQPEEIEDDLDPADDGESSEESHCSTNEAKLGLGFDLLVSLDVVKCCRFEINLYQMKFGLNLLPCKQKAYLLF